MRVYDLILKKRNGEALTDEEIDYLIDGYVRDSIPDYQVSALAMAVWFRGMSAGETLSLTRAMERSGETLSLDQIPGLKVDKHSTGGVGDKTTLVLAPLVAAAGVPVAKLSGRGLGHTGGTLDKLEAIPGFKTDLDLSEMINLVRDTGVAVAGQTGNLVPADKKLYALRDLTATVDSIPLIAASIMSKKLAAGADAIVLDVKTGDGAFMKEREAAFELARTMVEIGRGAGRKTIALVSSMEQPLGRAVGNALEVKEAIAALRGEGPPDLQRLCLALAGHMLMLAGKVSDEEEGRLLLAGLIRSGAALEKFKEMVRGQHGDPAVADNPGLLPSNAEIFPVPAEESGFVSTLKAEAIGTTAMMLGAGREKKDDRINPSVGIVLDKKIGDRVIKGDLLARVYARPGEKPGLVDAALEKVSRAYSFSAAPVEAPELILGLVE